MTYNIRYDTTSDGINQWSLPKHNVINLIRIRAPDLFGLQEALREQIADLNAALPAYRYYAVGDRDGKNRSEFAPIFYRSDRFDFPKHQQNLAVKDGMHVLHEYVVG